MKSVFISLSLSIFSCCVFFLSAEVVCRIWFPDLEIRYLDDPELLWTYAPNQTAYMTLANGQRSPSNRINNLGLRGENIKAQGGLLFLGDSFTFGAGVADNETFAFLTAESLGSKDNFTNAGQGAYGLHQMLGMLRRIIPLKQPEHVILTVWEGSLLRQPPTEAEKNDFYSRSSKLKKLKRVSVFATHVYRLLERLLINWGYRPIVADLSGVRASEVPLLEQYRCAFERERNTILAIRDECAAHGAAFHLVLWPSRGFVFSSDNPEPLTPLQEERLEVSGEVVRWFEQFSTTERLNFTNVEKIFYGYPKNELVIPGDGHPTVTAHRLAAGVIAEAIKANTRKP